MSFAKSARRFARIGSRHDAALYGGQKEDGTCDADGFNLSISGTKFREPFAIIRDEAQALDLGFSHNVQATITLPRCSGITVVIETDGGQPATEFTYLPTGDVYRVVSQKVSPLTGKNRLGLRRLPLTA